MTPHDVFPELTAHARATISGLPADWRVFRAEVLDDGSTLAEGAVAYVVTRGPRKGQTTWRTPLQHHRRLMAPAPGGGR